MIKVTSTLWKVSISAAPYYMRSNYGIFVPFKNVGITADIFLSIEVF